MDDDNDDHRRPPPRFLEEMMAAAVRHVSAMDQLSAASRTRRTQIRCGRCNGPYLIWGLRTAPEGDCGCERRCQRAACLAPDEGLGDMIAVPNYPFG